MKIVGERDSVYNMRTSIDETSIKDDETLL